MDNWYQEFQTNTRLRVGMWLILAILLSYIIVWLGQYRHQLSNDYQAAFARLNQLQRIAEQTDWLARAQTAQGLRQQVEKTLWSSDNPGLARAELQNWLEQEMQKAGILQARSKLKLAEVRELPQPIPLWQISAHINNVPFEVDILHDFLLAITAHPQLVLVENLEIHDTQRRVFSLVVTAYFQAITTG